MSRIVQAINEVLEERMRDKLLDGWGIDVDDMTPDMERAMREARLTADAPAMESVYRALDTDDLYDHVRFTIDSIIAAKR